MKLTFRIIGLSRETANNLTAIKVTAQFNAPPFPVPAQIPAAQAAPWNQANERATVTFFVPEHEGAKLHIDEEFTAELHAHGQAA